MAVHLGVPLEELAGDRRRRGVRAEAGRSGAQKAPEGPRRRTHLKGVGRARRRSGPRARDSKFPTEDYHRLIAAQEKGDANAIEESMKSLETQLRRSAKDICQKYINPPRTTDFALMFLPTEGLYAEAIRRIGLVEQVQRDCRVVFAGPTTLAALLNSLQMGFRTLAIQKRSSEVWNLLAGVKTEFGKFGEALSTVKDKLDQAARQVDNVAVRSRAITRKLRDVEELPSNPQPLLKNLLSRQDREDGD